MKKVIITGATGMVGGLVLKRCLESSEVSSIISISRKPSGESHPKLTEVIRTDFENFDGLEDAFSNIDAAYFCLGVYTGAVSDELFKKITVDYVISFADKLKQHSPNSTFSLLSGAGADPEEKSRTSFARYKGMAENYLISKDFKGLHIFRPAYIYPVEKRTEPNAMYSISRALYPLIKLFGKNASIPSTELARAMFERGLSEKTSAILENKEILAELES